MHIIFLCFADLQFIEEASVTTIYFFLEEDVDLRNVKKQINLLAIGTIDSWK